MNEPSAKADACAVPCAIASAASQREDALPLRKLPQRCRRAERRVGHCGGGRFAFTAGDAEALPLVAAHRTKLLRRLRHAAASIAAIAVPTSSTSRPRRSTIPTRSRPSARYGPARNSHGKSSTRRCRSSSAAARADHAIENRTAVPASRRRVRRPVCHAGNRATRRRHRRRTRMRLWPRSAVLTIRARGQKRA